MRDSNGKSFYQEDVNDINDIPVISKMPEIKLSSEEAQQVINKAFIANKIEVSSVKVSDNELGGKFADIELKTLAQEVNPTIPKIEQWILELNASSGVGITQYDLNIYDKDHNLLEYLSADLMFRDFLWWQSPMIGTTTWTGHSPETAADSATKTNNEATYEPGIGPIIENPSAPDSK